jgi:hypothetical protein
MFRAPSDLRVCRRPHGFGCKAADDEPSLPNAAHASRVIGDVIAARGLAIDDVAGSRERASR